MCIYFSVGEKNTYTKYIGIYLIKYKYLNYINIISFLIKRINIFSKSEKNYIIDFLLGSFL